MKSNKSLKDSRILLTPQWNYGYKIKTKYVPISVTTMTFPTTTTTRIATQLQSPYRPYRILNIDNSMKLAHQHASCVDTTHPASIHKSRLSILPTYNINTSDHYTHPIHCHAVHHHRTTTTSTTSPETTTARYYRMKNIYHNNEIDQIAQGL